jgi:hypothetical protein
MADDYKEMGMLDQYDEQLLDDRDYRPLNIDQRFEAERKMQERDRRERRAGAFGMSESDGEEGTGSGSLTLRKAAIRFTVAFLTIELSSTPFSFTPFVPLQTS